MCLIIKFGGSSLKNKNILLKVLTIIENKSKIADILVVVCSACGDTTNSLLSLIPFIETSDIFRVQQTLRKIYDHHHSLLNSNVPTIFTNYFNQMKELCMSLLGKKVSDCKTAELIGYGELMSSCIIFSLLSEENKDKNIVKVDSRELIKTDSNYLNANIQYNVTYQYIKQKIVNYGYNIVIAPGFIGSNQQNEPTVLGRGGSDLTASLFAIALNAEQVEIWSDRDGIMTSDPRYINGTQLIEQLTYEQLFNLSYYGAKIVFYKTVLPLFGKKINTWIRNTYNPENRGTLICSRANKTISETNKLNNEQSKQGEQNKVLAITTLSDIVLIKIFGIKIKQCVGFSAKMFQSLSDKGINIIAISQESSEFSIYICIESKEADKAKSILEWVFVKEIRQGELALSYCKQISIVSLIHKVKKDRTRILEECVHIINEEQIPIYILNSGDYLTCFVTDLTYTHSICQTLHDHFFLTQTEKLNKTKVFIIGLGNVGTRVYSMLKDMKQYDIVGVSNSKGYLYEKNGLEKSGEECRQKLYSEQMEKNSLSLAKLVSIYSAQTNRCIVVDTTSSKQIVQWYPTFIQQKIPLVVANKKGLSSDIELFDKLLYAYNKNLFQFETTVCAGLPVLQTLLSLRNSNHTITKIEGILSGTCNFVCTQLGKGNHTFSTIIKNALDKGITEPHPYDDLCGMDVARKLLILARCCGEKIGLEDIEVEPLVSIPKKDVSIYLEECKQFDEEFTAYSKLENSTVKYIATYDNSQKINKYTIKKQTITQEHPFYSVNNTLNVVAIYTNIYTQPLVISGFGAGIGATAAGVVSDIVKLCS